MRRPPDPPFSVAVEICLTDAHNKNQIAAAISGFDAVVNVIGGGTLRRNNVASTATANAVAAAQDAVVRRYIAISAGMVALEWPFFKYVLRPLIFRHIVAEHRRVEEIVKASNLAWTIVRPSRLTNQPAKGYAASLQLNAKAFMTTRADLAEFIAEELNGSLYVRQGVFVTSRLK